MEAYNFGYCLGVVEGAYANASGSAFCPPTNYRVKSALELVVKFVKDHPELEEKYPANIVRWALSDEFPCPDPDHSHESDTQGGTQ